MKSNSTPVVLPAGRTPIHNYRELQRQLHDDLRAQHPEWVGPNGESPICDSYERRLAELIQLFQSTEVSVVSQFQRRAA